MACENVVYSNSLRLITKCPGNVQEEQQIFVKDIDEDTDGVDASFEENIIIIFTFD